MTASDRGARGEVGMGRHLSPAGAEAAPASSQMEALPARPAPPHPREGPAVAPPAAPSPAAPPPPDGSSDVPGPLAAACFPPEWHPAMVRTRARLATPAARRTRPGAENPHSVGVFRSGFAGVD